MEDNMSMFSRKPVVNYKALDEAIVPQRAADYAPRNRTIDGRRERLDFLRGEFNRHAGAARSSAEEWMHEYNDLIAEIGAARDKLVSDAAHLDAIEANLPPIPGGSNEKAVPTHPPTAGFRVASGSQANLPSVSERHGQTLPSDRREEVLVPREEPVKGHPDLDIKF